MTGISIPKYQCALDEHTCVLYHSLPGMNMEDDSCVCVGVRVWVPVSWSNYMFVIRSSSRAQLVDCTCCEFGL